jgi:hemerythrin
MATTSWSESLELGVAEVDVEHRLQIQLVDAFHAALARGDRPAAGEALARLDDASNVHFMGEELLMRLHSHPEYEAHVEEHRQLLDRLRVLRVRFEARSDGEALATVDEVRRWLSHIRGADRSFAAHVARGGLAG